MPTTSSDAIRVGALTITFVLDAETSGGCATAFECDVPANAVMPAPHSHDGFEELNYGLTGVTTFTVDGERRELHPVGSSSSRAARCTRSRTAPRATRSSSPS